MRANDDDDLVRNRVWYSYHMQRAPNTKEINGFQWWPVLFAISCSILNIYFSYCFFFSSFLLIIQIENCTQFAPRQWCLCRISIVRLSWEKNRGQNRKIKNCFYTIAARNTQRTQWLKTWMRKQKRKNYIYKTWTVLFSVLLMVISRTSCRTLIQFVKKFVLLEERRNRTCVVSRVTPETVCGCRFVCLLLVFSCSRSSQQPAASSGHTLTHTHARARKWPSADEWRRTKHRSRFPPCVCVCDRVR